MKKSLSLLIFLFYFLQISGQKENPSSFNSITLTYKFHPKFFLFAEGQLRGIEDFSYPDYYEIKGGIGYNLTKNHKPFIGIGRYGNYTNKEFVKEEFRFWLQDVIDLKMGKFKFENRFRAEKSWFYEPIKDVHSQRVRLRYRLNISVPLNSETVEPGTIFVNAFDEVFFVATDDPLFARNRFFSGFGYQIDRNFGIASGYVWQREFGKTSNKNIHSIFLALNISIDKAEKKIYPFPGAD
ncbi:DUF2490 domain-containing protein [Frigoriflavimonas asaccharolytica]|uniref:DUF2490 domain-containing protein n=1 Tax=Frigoriflavimonas asaccharolytica TaxID=2735899 RepID=A0A8J8G822_9FLAO|nr:DUF2490 domain-containing protein [Frigoriflavimonas asaccharolytica]NRS93193.1 hypothetical protein [Frigoriflavimonas asaccharolytica]